MVVTIGRHRLASPQSSLNSVSALRREALQEGKPCHWSKETGREAPRFDKHWEHEEQIVHSWPSVSVMQIMEAQLWLLAALIDVVKSKTHFPDSGCGGSAARCSVTSLISNFASWISLYDRDFPDA